MKLESILKGIDYSILSGSLDTLINDIKYDSRKVEKNDIYIALKGFTSDGHDYIPEAISKGASVIVVSKMVSIHGDVTVIKVDDTRTTLSYMADNYFGNPSESLITIGVTGTTGKTTTTHMIRDMLEAVGVKCGLIGSIGIKYNDIVEHTNNTTPESYEVHRAFKTMLDAGMTHVVMECSSQAFKMHRLAGITFDLGVLTNVTTDHIGPGEHESQEEYVSCKNMLFLNSKKVISNNDSDYLKDVLKDVEVPIVTYALNNKADIKVGNIELINSENFFGSEFNTIGLINDTFRTSIPGEFNIYNSLCSLAVINTLGIDSSKAKEALLNVKVRGRMETALVTPKFKALLELGNLLTTKFNAAFASCCIKLKLPPFITFPYLHK